MTDATKINEDQDPREVARTSQNPTELAFFLNRACDLVDQLGPEAMLHRFTCLMLQDQHRRVVLGMKAPTIIGAKPTQHVGYQWTIVSDSTADFDQAIRRAYDAFHQEMATGIPTAPPPENVTEIYPGPRKGK